MGLRSMLVLLDYVKSLRGWKITIYTARGYRTNRIPEQWAVNRPGREAGQRWKAASSTEGAAQLRAANRNMARVVPGPCIAPSALIRVCNLIPPLRPGLFTVCRCSLKNRT